MTPKVDLSRLKKEHWDDDDYDYYLDLNSRDPDTRFGPKTPQTGFYP